MDQLVALLVGLFVIYVLGWLALISLGEPRLGLVLGAAYLLFAWRVDPPREAGVLRWVVALFAGFSIVADLASMVLG